MILLARTPLHEMNCATMSHNSILEFKLKFIFIGFIFQPKGTNSCWFHYPWWRRQNILGCCWQTTSAGRPMRPHVRTTVDKAISALGFLKRNLKKCSATLKERADIAYVCSILDYASPIWDSHLKKDISTHERVYSRAGCYVTGD